MTWHHHPMAAWGSEHDRPCVVLKAAGGQIIVPDDTAASVCELLAGVGQEVATAVAEQDETLAARQRPAQQLSRSLDDQTQPQPLVPELACRLRAA